MKNYLTLHLLELRQRTIYVLFSFCMAFCMATFYSVPLTHLLCFPLFSGAEKTFFFIFTHVTEGLYASIELSLVCAFSFSIPTLMYQIHSFFIPSCYQGERRKIQLILFFVVVLFLISFFSAYLLILPKICTFLRQFQYSSKCMEIKLEARIAPAVHWSCAAFLWTALFFQTPVMFATFCRFSRGGCPPAFFKKNRKNALFILLITASLFSPPEVSIQCALAALGFFLFEFFFLCTLFFQNWYRKPTS